MGGRFGGVAGAVALAAGLVLALWVAIGGRGIDLASGTYAFTQPATDYADAKRSLVQSGVVTDVWISEADRANQNFGYTPNTPAEVFAYPDESSTITTRGDSVSQCWFVGTADEHCTLFEDIERVSAVRAGSVSEWTGLEDGSYGLWTRSVTWEQGSSYVVEVENGVVQNAPSPDLDLPAIDTKQWGQPGSDWVLYWVNGAPEPFAACYDEVNTYDEEWCIEWLPV